MPTRRRFLQSGTVAAAAPLFSGMAAAQESPTRPEDSISVGDDLQRHPLLTPADLFRDVSRGNPKPHQLTGDALVQARLTPESWRLEIAAEPSTNESVEENASVRSEFTLSAGTALDLPALHELGRTRAVRYLKAMQCLNIPQPLGQGLWEGVPLRDVLRLCGPMRNVRRISYYGFHNNDPKQMFRSSLSYAEAMETAPGDPPVFVAYGLNGEPISLERGGPVRMIVPWAYGFKSIKWLQRIVLSNDYQPNDTYALKNNDPSSPMKSAAYIDKLSSKFAGGESIRMSGLVVSGFSGVERVEYWLRRVEEDSPAVTWEDAEWQSASWTPCAMEPEPKRWDGILPDGVSSHQLTGFDTETGRPKSWPLRYGMASWTAVLKDLSPGRYEFRARVVDRNGFAQPEPRPMLKAGRNAVEVHSFEVG